MGPERQGSKGAAYREKEICHDSDERRGRP
jgi:hypothetical protein